MESKTLRNRCHYAGLNRMIWTSFCYISGNNMQRMLSKYFSQKYPQTMKKHHIPSWIMTSQFLRLVSVRFFLVPTMFYGRPCSRHSPDLKRPRFTSMQLQNIVKMLGQRIKGLRTYLLGKEYAFEKLMKRAGIEQKKDWKSTRFAYAIIQVKQCIRKHHTVNQCCSICAYLNGSRVSCSAYMLKTKLCTWTSSQTISVWRGWIVMI